MAALLNVPTELFYNYAKYIDLLDFGALLFTCKDLHNRLHEDLVFKKCVFDHSPSTCHNLHSASRVRRKFIDYHAKLAVNNNDAESLLFYFPTITCDSILQQIRPINPELQKQLGRSNLLEQIDAANADKVLSFIISSFVSDVACHENEQFLTRKPRIIDFMFLIADQFLKPTDDINELKQRPERKTTLLVLELFKKYEDHAWVKLIELNKKRDIVNFIRRNENGKNSGAGSYLKTLFYFQELYPEYKWDINHPIDEVCIRGVFVPSTKHIRNVFANMTVVDYALLCSDFEIFDFLVDRGATIPEDFPRRRSAFTKSDIGRNKRKRMFLTMSLEPGPRDANSSFLYFFVNKLNLDGYQDYTNNVKKLIALGARFTKDELTEILRMHQSNKYLIIAAKEIRKLDSDTTNNNSVSIR